MWAFRVINLKYRLHYAFVAIEMWAIYILGRVEIVGTVCCNTRQCSRRTCYSELVVRTKLYLELYTIRATLNPCFNFQAWQTFLHSIPPCSSIRLQTNAAVVLIRVVLVEKPYFRPWIHYRADVPRYNTTDAIAFRCNSTGHGFKNLLAVGKLYHICSS